VASYGQPPYAGHPYPPVHPHGPQPVHGGGPAPLHPVGPYGQQPAYGMYAPAPPPAVGPVVAFTALFGIFGAISASNRAKRAAASGASTSGYWVAFGVTLVVSWIFWTAVFAAVSAANPAVDSASLEQSIVRDGDFTSDAGPATVTQALCTPSSVDSDGAGIYRCMVDFGDGTRTSYEVTVDAGGTWVTE
jgi:hypothetical protein